ncbi:MAG: cysteine peptidase family C39 domain-containing protein [Arcanobacterium sp.]|nr:cysteine peptidase family C39 domain-containing protein [Arcanobacterium sp.]
MKIIKQQSEKDCLLACFAMVLSVYGINRDPYSVNPNPHAFESDGLRASHLRDLCEAYGLKLNAYRVSPSNLLEYAGKTDATLILHLVNNHYVVLAKANKRLLVINDPAYGVRRVYPSELEGAISGAVLSISQDPSSNVIVNKKNPLKKTSVFSLFSKTGFLWMFASFFCIQAMALLYAALLRYLVEKNSGFQYLLIAIGCIGIITALSALVQMKALEKGARDFDNSYSSNLIRSMAHQPLAFFERSSIGALIEKLSLRTTVRDTLQGAIVPQLFSAIASTVLLGFIAYYTPVVSVVLLLGVAFFAGVNYFIVTKQKELTIGFIQRQQDFSTRIQHDVEDIAVLISTRQTSTIAEEWIRSNELLTSSYLSLAKLVTVAQSLSSFFTYASNIFLAVYLAFCFKEGVINLGEMLMIQSCAALAVSGLKDVLNSLTGYVTVRQNLDRNNDLTAMQVQQLFVEGSSSSEIVAKDLSVTLPGGKRLDYGTSSFAPGEKIFLVGRSGIGKTTFIKTLLGLIPHEGDLYQPSSFNGQVGVSLADTPVGGLTVREFLAGESGKKDDSLLWAALKTVSLDQRIEEFPLTLDSLLLENGSNLSSGEKKRLAIARALVSAKNGWVFLDEPYLGLNQNLANYIHSNLEANQQLSIMLVTHNLQMLKPQDNVVFFNEISPPEIGTHAQLLETSTLYRTYYKSQIKGDDDAKLCD